MIKSVLQTELIHGLNGNRQGKDYRWQGYPKGRYADLLLVTPTFAEKISFGVESILLAVPELDCPLNSSTVPTSLLSAVFLFAINQIMAEELDAFSIANAQSSLNNMSDDKEGADGTCIFKLSLCLRGCFLGVASHHRRARRPGLLRRFPWN